MTAAHAYSEELAALRGLVAQPTQGIHLVEFATLPQLERILADLRPLCSARSCVEVIYDPPHESAAELVASARQQLASVPQEPPPLLILRPLALPNAATDGPSATAFWKALNFRREALGSLPAQILLCVDPWHHQHLVDEALDLLSWAMPRFRLIPVAEVGPVRTEMLFGAAAFAKFEISPEAARARWKTFWPIVEKQRRNGPIPPSWIRTHILPLIESSLAVGNLVQAREVRDVAVHTPIPFEDLVEWHRLNAILACGSGDLSLAKDHAESLLRLMTPPDNSGQSFRAAVALMQVTNLLGDLGDPHAELNLNRRLVAFFETAVGPDHPNTLTSRNNLAVALSNHGQNAEAEQEHRATLDNLQRVFGPEHPHTLACRNNLANSLHGQGKHAEAEIEQRTVLETRERALGLEHPDTLNVRHNLASSLQDQGKYPEAEREFRRLAETRGRVLGVEHPHTLNSRNNLANTLSEQGKHAESEREHRAVLAARERVFGSDHPEVFQSCLNLAICLAVQGKAREGLELAQRATEGFERVLGPEHPDTQNARIFIEQLRSAMAELDTSANNNSSASS